MTRSRLLLLAAGLSLTACQQDFKLNPENDGDVGIKEGEIPDIEVSPASITFDDILVGEGEVLTQIVTVSNVGVGTLFIQDLELSDAEAPYTLGAVGSVEVPPGEYTEFAVTFAPETAGETSVLVYVDSNDPDEPTVEVPLGGLGIAPVILVSPEIYDFGDLYIGCENYTTVTIDNVGNAPLVVESFDFNTGSEDMSFDMNIEVNGPLPWTITPEAEPLPVLVSYYPLDEVSDIGYLKVNSNDPFQPTVLATQEGHGVIYGMQTDVYEQPLNGPVDILFAVDKSCSMDDDIQNVRSNFETFAGRLGSLDSDYHIAVVVSDDGCFAGSVNYIDDSMSTTEQQNAFDDMLDGTAGTFTEAPFQLELNALAQSSGGCNDGFLREEAALSLVNVSDEVEQSPNSWEYYVDTFRSLKADEDDVVMHAIAGDYPGGCGGNEPGVGHYEATLETGGEFLSICATDFGAHLEAIAVGSVSDNDNFVLTLEPVPETIEVALDGSLTTEGWTYSGYEEGNYVHFDNNHIPEAGSTIEITYVIKAECTL